jgi:hypothetical protein
MTYQPHVRLTMEGSLYASASEANPIEIFSCTLNLLPTVDFDPLTDPIPPDVITACNAWFGRAATGIHPYCFLETIKYNTIDSSGHYAQDFSVQHVQTGVHGGGSEGFFMAPQVSYCVSLATGNRGARNRGRFYVPFPTLQVTQNRRMDPTQQNNAKNSAVTFLNDINATANVQEVVVASGAGTGTNSPVTQVRVGDVFDTQRRRRNGLPESYVVGDVTF